MDLLNQPVTGGNHLVPPVKLWCMIRKEKLTTIVFMGVHEVNFSAFGGPAL